MLDNLIWILEKSVEKNGEVLLTNKHLLNIIRMLKRKEDFDFEREIKGADLFEGFAEIEDCGDR